MSKYPLLYAKDATNFFTAGLGPLKNTIKVNVIQERNGSYYLEMEYLIDSEEYLSIVEDAIIKADADHILKDQLFRVKKINPTSKGKATIYAEHVSYITNELSLKPDVYINNMTAAQALRIWSEATIDSHSLLVDSDISTQATTHWRIDKVENARQALGGVEGSILDCYGGEYRFDNYHISLLKKRGKPANTLLSYGRNIVDLEQERNIVNTYTSIYPYATHSDENQKEHLITVPGYLIDSEYVNKFPNRKALTIDFSSEFENDEKPSSEKLSILAKKYIKDNKIGIPHVSISLSFLDLSKTLDYKEIAPLEELSLCDEVLVRFPKLGINTTAKVIRTVWNVLTESYDEIEIGDVRSSLSSIMKEQQAAIKEVQSNSNYALVAANGKNMIFYGLYGEDGLGEPIAIKVGDMWYKPNGDETEFYIWNGTIWEFVMSTKEVTEAKEAADQAQKEAEEATEKANIGVEKANQAIKEISDLSSTISEVKGNAADALNQSVDALNTAKESLSKSSQINDKVVNLETNVDKVKGEIALKANQTDLNKLDGTIKTQGTQLSANTETIKLKASQSDVNTLSGRVSTTEGQINVLNNQIALKVSKNDVQGMLTPYATQIWTQGQIKIANDSVVTRVEKVESTVTNLNSGSANLLVDSQGVTNWSIATATNVNQSQVNESESPYGKAKKVTMDIGAGGVHRSPVRKLVVGKTYSWSVYIKANVEGVMKIGQEQGGTRYVNVTTAYQRFTHTFVATDSHYASFVYYRTGIGQSITEYLIHSPVLVEGNIIPTWSDSMSDLVNQIQFSEVKVTINSIQQTVAGKADQSQITQLSNQITSVVKDVSQVDLKTRIAGGLVMSPDPDFGKGLNEIVVYNNSGDDAVTVVRESVAAGSQPTGNPFRLKIQTTAAASPVWGGIRRITMSRINAEFVVRFTALLPVGRRFQPANNSLGNNATVKWLTSNVGTGSWKEYMYHVRCGDSGAFQSFGHLYVSGGGTPSSTNPLTWYLARYEMIDITQSNQSQITQLADQINLRVQKNDIVNQINISTESILIAGNKVQITGQTYIQDAVIQSSKIASVVADKINTGTLNAALVNIINLNANNITSGYINSNRILAKSITADKLTADAIQVGFNAMGNTMKINSLSLSFYIASTLTGRLTGSGMEYWYGNRKVGSTGEASKTNNVNVRGISNSLESTGDFITWSYKKKSTDISYTPMLTLDPKGAFTGTSGIHVDQDLYCHANIGIQGAYQNLKFSVVRYNNVFFPALTNSATQAGVLFGASELYFMKNNKIWTLTKIVNLVDKLSGMGSIAIARSFRNDGTANSWSTLTI